METRPTIQDKQIMQLSVNGRQIDVGDALRSHIEDSLNDIFGKYFGDAIEATVTMSREGPMYHALVNAHVGRGIQLVVENRADKPYTAFDGAADRLSKRLRRHKRRLRDHHRESNAETIQTMAARQYVLASDSGEAEQAETANGQPAVIADMSHEIPSLTVGEAVMRLDLADLPAMMFRNSAHGGMNVIYRRNDGNIGWIDPQGNSSAN
jgi:ribosomal subunit interface protein